MSTHSPLLSPSVQFVPEDEAEAMRRYTGFAADFYARLYSEHPVLRGRFRFFRDTLTDDIWSVCELADCSFGVQLDPLIEVIVVWDAASH